MIQQMTLDDRKIFPDIFHPVSLSTEEPLWVLFDWSAISLDIQLRSVPYFTTNRPFLKSLYFYVMFVIFLLLCTFSLELVLVHSLLNWFLVSRLKRERGGMVAVKHTLSTLCV